MTMKRFLLHTILFSVLLPFMAGCSRTEDVPATGADDVLLDLSVSTRSGNLPQEGKETGEGVPDNMHLWIYGADANGALKDLAYIHKEDGIFTGRDLYGNPVESIRGVRITNGKLFDRLCFYLVLNSESVTWTDGDVAFDKDTSLETLEALAFKEIASGKEDNRLLMYGETEVEITSSSNYDVVIPADRAMAKMEIHFAKRYAESTLTVHGIDLLPVVKVGYLVPDALTEEDYEESVAAEPLFSGAAAITGVSAIEEDFHKEGENFTLLASSCLLENPGDVLPYKVRVRYTVDGMEKEQEFELPQALRNHLYRIYVRVAPGDKPVRFEVEVKDWADGGTGDIDEWQ